MDSANSIKNNLRTCNLKTGQFISYVFQMVKKISHLQMNIFCRFNFIIEEMPYECIQGIVWQVCYQIRLMISANRSITISCNFLHLFSIVHQGGTSANAQRRPSELVGPGGRCHPNFDRFYLFSSFFAFWSCTYLAQFATRTVAQMTGLRYILPCTSKVKRVEVVAKREI